MISSHTDGNHGLDLEHHFQAASTVLYANTSVLTEKTMSIANQLTYFDAMVTPVACLASGHHKIYKQVPRKISQVGHQIPQTRAHHCGPSWELQLVCSMARHPPRVERTRVGMC